MRNVVAGILWKNENWEQNVLTAVIRKKQLRFPRKKRRLLQMNKLKIRFMLLVLKYLQNSSYERDPDIISLENDLKIELETE